MSHKLKKWLLTGSCLFLLIVGVVFIKIDTIKAYLIHHQGASYSLKHVTVAELQANQKQTATFDFAAVQSLNASAVFQAQIKSESLPVVGSIALPAVGIHLPIFKGLANESLLAGAGTTSPTQQLGQGNYGLVSHRTYNPDLLFTPLERVQIGDQIYLTDLVNIYIYTTIKTRIVDPSEVEILAEVPGKKLVTLITCGDMDALTRQMVQGELTKVTAWKQAPPEVTALFT